MANVNNPAMMSFLKLRRMIGILGILLPILLIIGTLGCGMQSSMSTCYYTKMGDVFVAALGAMALFFLTDTGYDNNDNVANKIAGICMLVVAFCACEPNHTNCAIRFLADSKIRVAAHYISAGTLFTDLGLISLFLFTKSSGVMTERKKMRNVIYKICGIVILGSVLSLGIISKFNLIQQYKPTFICEMICLFSFGFSWLVKGETILQDN